jgi:glycerate 2-kinase
MSKLMFTRTIIKNRADLATSRKRSQALDILEAGVARVLPDAVLQTLSFDHLLRQLKIGEHVHEVKGRIFVIGAGKAAGLMAQILEHIIGTEDIEAGIVVDKAAPSDFGTTRIKVLQAGHPIPDQRGIKAVQSILSLKSQYQISERDLILCLISGGGSALMPGPVSGLSLEEKQAVTRLLLSCGADIYEINSVRKHLSRIKGGWLAQYFSPTPIVSIILSDVVGDDLSVIASGLTCPDSSTYRDAVQVLKKYRLENSVPSQVITILESGCRQTIAETPKSLHNTFNYILACNRLALEAMAEEARSQQLKPLIITASQTGDTGATARQRAGEILAGNYRSFDTLILGGETVQIFCPKCPEPWWTNKL